MEIETRFRSVRERRQGEPVVVLDESAWEQLKRFILSQRKTIDQLCLALLKQEGRMEEMGVVLMKEKEEKKQLQEAIKAQQENRQPAGRYAAPPLQELVPQCDNILLPEKEDLLAQQMVVLTAPQPSFLSPPMSTAAGLPSSGNSVVYSEVRGGRLPTWVEEGGPGWEEDAMDADEAYTAEQQDLMEALARLGEEGWRGCETRGNPYIQQLKRAAKEYREAIEKMLQLGVGLEFTELEAE